MNRVEQAIQDGRCVLAIGGRALADTEILMELRRRAAVPMVTLGASPTDPAVAITETSVAAAFSGPGGVLVLVEPDTAGDGKGLNELGLMVQKASNKPRLVIAARAFNPFTLPPALRMLKMEQERKRARDFLGSLPVVDLAPVVEEPKIDVREAPAKKQRMRAPMPEFVGREQELVQLSEFLQAGGPIVVAGAPGIGRRWLVAKALSEHQGRVLPEVYLSRGSGFDTLFSRLAAWLDELGEGRLTHAHRTPEERPTPAALVALTLECLQNERLADAVMVVHGIDTFMRDDGSFHRNGRLEMLLTGLVRNTYAPRIIFITQRVPTFYREGEGANLRAMVLGGLKGRELYHVFTACRIEDVPRDKMGEVHNRTHGHPVATRAFALSTRGGKLEALLTDGRFLHMDNEADLETLSRHLRNRLEKLPAELKQALARVAHLRQPCNSDFLQILEISRETRIALQSRGLLESLSDGEDRAYYVHDLIKENMPRRDITDFALYETLANHYGEQFQKARGVQRLALGQEANYFATLARRTRNLWKVGYPDQDALVASVRELLYGYKPRPEMAEERINYVAKQDPAHVEAFLLKVEAAVARDASPKAIEAIYNPITELAPTPELFHHRASWLLEALRPGDPTGAIEALSAGCQVFPQNGRLRRRLAGVLRKENRIPEAVAVLREAMDIEPLMPDTYGLLGDIHMNMGMAHWGEATAYLEESLRLHPDDALNMTRVGRLYRLRGLADPEQREAYWQKAEECFKQATQIRAEYGFALIEWATMYIDRADEVDLDRVAWMLNQAERQKRHPPELRVLRARLRARRGQPQKAEEAVRRWVQQDPKNFGTRAALGEIQYARGRVFDAFQSYQRAQEDAPHDAPERLAFEVILAQLRALIESGAAIEIQRRAEEEEASGLKREENEQDGDHPPRERAVTTRRRRARDRRPTEPQTAEGEAAAAETSGEESDAHWPNDEDDATDMPNGEGFAGAEE